MGENIIFKNFDISVDNNKKKKTSKISKEITFRGMARIF